MRGHIEERGPGRFRVVVYAGRDDNGKKIYVKRTVRGTRDDADTELARLFVEVREGRVVTTKDSFGELMDAYVEARAIEDPPWRPSTLRSARQSVRRLPAWLRDLPLGKLDRGVLRQHYADLARQGRSAKTIARLHALIHPALQRAVEDDLIAKNPAHGIRPMGSPAKRTRPPTDEELERLLKAADDGPPWWRLYLVLAATTGARRGELAALTWGQVDLEQGIITIDRALSVGNVVEPKTRAGRRRVALDRGTVKLLAAHQREFADQLARFGGEIEPARYVFTRDPEGLHPYSTSHISYLFGQTCQRAGVTGIRLHDLRHYVGTRLAAGGVDPRTIAGRLGHSDVAFTLNTYADFFPPADREAARYIGDLVTGWQDGSEVQDADGGVKDDTAA